MKAALSPGLRLALYLSIPSFFLWPFPCLDMVPFDVPFGDIPVVSGVLPLVSDAPAGGWAGFLLESFTLGWLRPV
jgi:hypothetical protein